MTQGQITPWSQLDDELEENEGLAHPPGNGAHLDEDGAAAPASSGVTPGSPFAGRLSKVEPHWALVPLALAAVCLLAAMILKTGEGTGISTWPALIIFALILAAGGLLFTSRRARRDALAGIHRAITLDPTQTHQVFEGLPVAEEFQPLWRAVKQHTANIDKRAADLLEEHKQLGLDLSLADTQKRHLEVILNSIPHPILVTDAYDRLFFANTAAEADFQFKCPEALRQPIDKVIVEEELVEMIRQARAADSRVANRRLELEIGPRAWALTLSSFASGPRSGETNSESHGVVVLLRDITKQRVAAKMKSEFVARAAHELRTPLSSIRAYVEMLVDGEAADEKVREEYYDIIQTSADRLGRMIDNILNISRIEAGTVRINKEPVAVSLIVKEATDMARPQAEEKGISLTEDLTPVAYQILADKDMIYQAVLNLLSNAIKYTPQGGEVHVRMEPHEENGTIGIEVSDTGVGIPKEDLPKMFEKFFRVEANKKMAKGTGLGLNLVKNIVEAIHGGRVILNSEVGKGSTFSIVLPLLS
jgi:two-component system phosphate regulon sensor histidine kinase PhoR